jgi:hypothetical protein
MSVFGLSQTCGLSLCLTLLASSGIAAAGWRAGFSCAKIDGRFLVVP